MNKFACYRVVAGGDGVEHFLFELCGHEWASQEDGRTEEVVFYKERNVCFEVAEMFPALAFTSAKVPEREIPLPGL